MLARSDFTLINRALGALERLSSNAVRLSTDAASTASEAVTSLESFHATRTSARDAIDAVAQLGDESRTTLLANALDGVTELSPPGAIAFGARLLKIDANWMRTSILKNAAQLSDVIAPSPDRIAQTRDALRAAFDETSDDPLALWRRLVDTIRVGTATPQNAGLHGEFWGFPSEAYVADGFIPRPEMRDPLMKTWRLQLDDNAKKPTLSTVRRTLADVLHRPDDLTEEGIERLRSVAVRAPEHVKRLGLDPNELVELHPWVGERSWKIQVNRMFAMRAQFLGPDRARSVSRDEIAKILRDAPKGDVAGDVLKRILRINDGALGADVDLGLKFDVGGFFATFDALKMTPQDVVSPTMRRRLDRANFLRDVWVNQVDEALDDPTALRTTIAKLVGTSDAQSNDEQLRAIAILAIAREQDIAKLGLPTKIGTMGLERIFVEPHTARIIDSGFARRIVDRWRAQLASDVEHDPDRIAARIHGLLARSANETASVDQAGLARLVDQHAVLTGSDSTLPEDLHGAINAWRTRLGMVHESRPGAVDVQPGDWQRLLTLFDEDAVTGRYGIARSSELVLPDAMAIRSDLAVGAEGGAVTRDLDALSRMWQLRLAGKLDDPATFSSAIHRVVGEALDGSSRATNAMAAIAANYADQMRGAGLVMQFEGQPVSQLIMDVHGFDLKRALRAWQMQLDPPSMSNAAAKAEVSAILSKPIEKLTDADRARVTSLADLHAIRTHQGDGAPSVPSPAGYAGPIYEQTTGHAQRTANTKARALSIVTKPVSTLTAGDRSALQHIDHFDAMTGALGLTRAIPDYPGWSMTSALADRDDTLIQRFTTMWQLDLGHGFAVPERLATRDGALGAMHIRRSDVGDFLKDSAYPYTAFHGNTNRETYENVAAKGALVEKNKRSAFGQGFYTTTSPGGWGDDIVEVAVNTTHPWIGTGDEFRAQFTHGIEDKYNAHEAVLAAGHDAAILRNQGGEGVDWVIGYRDDIMKIVVEDSPGQPDVRPRTPLRYEGAGA